MYLNERSSKLPSHLRHAEAVRQRGVEIHRLLRDAPPLLVGQIVERAHVVEAVRQLDQDDAHILGDGEQQLAIVLDLVAPAESERDVADLGDAIDDLGDLLAERAFDVRHGELRVLDHVVDQPAGHRDAVEVQLGQDLGHLNAVRDVVVARRALLSQCACSLKRKARARRSLSRRASVGSSAMSQPGMISFSAVATTAAPLRRSSRSGHGR